MKPATGQHTYTRKISAALMLLALIWLTISLPFVNEARQAAFKITTQSNTNTKNSSDNPFAGTTEEKSPSPNTLSEEYLHQQEEPAYDSPDKIIHTHHHSCNVYVAFHGELLSPPPEA